MNKRKIAAIAAAAVITAQFAGASVFAADASKTYYYINGIYYEDSSSARAASNGNTWTSTATGDYIPATAQQVYYSANRNKFYSSVTAAQNDGAYDTTVAYRTNEASVIVYNTGDSNNYYYGSTSTYRSSSYPYYSAWTGLYYPTYSAALAASGNRSSYVYNYTNNYVNTAYGWYSSLTGQYYSTRESALAASGWNGDYVFYRGYNAAPSSVVVNKKGELYYSAKTQTYFGDYASALAASNGNASQVQDIGYIADAVPRSQGSYFSSNTNSYYPNYASALYASGYDKGKVSYVGGGSATAVVPAYSPTGYYTRGTTGYYINGVYYPAAYGTLIDPYFAYYNAKNQETKSTTAKATTEEVKEGTPYVYESKRYAGWSTIVKYVNNAKKGATVNVNMNGTYVIDSSLLKAIKGKNVNVRFILPNGVKWTINGTNVSSTGDMNIYTEYNIDYIPDTLVAKAAKGGKTKAEIGVTTGFEKLGASSQITVKFSAKRAGLVATAYRYDPASGSLKGVAKTTVDKNGAATFNITAGGPYLVVLK
ncbi:MAG: hypothetical protein J6I96_00625 [Oscillospiraceae bacterium]|nr:hypothetical protein [Oscillospiraceae bacterium]